MTRILAIEPSAERGRLLRRLVRDAVRAEVTVVTSAQAALAAMAIHQPDLILTSSLIAPNEERELVTHLRQTPELHHLPVLTMPPVAEPCETERTGFLARLLLRPAAPQLAYDFGAIAGRIEEAIAQSKVALAAQTSRPTVVVDPPPAPSPEARAERIPGCEDIFSVRKRAMRWAGWQLPWLSSVKVPSGIDLRLVNLSTTGLLVESGARIAPGATTTFHLLGPNRDLTVPARIVRSDVASVDRLGVKYRAAAVFDYAFDTLMPAFVEPTDPAAHLNALADTICQKAASGARSAELRAEFEAGVMQLVTARDVRLRDVPVVEDDGRESVYFTIPTDDLAILQVTFEANYQPKLDEFAALKAAVTAAAQVIAVTGTARQLRLSERTTPRVSEPLRLVPHAPESALELRPTA